MLESIVIEIWSKILKCLHRCLQHPTLNPRFQRRWAFCHCSFVDVRSNRVLRKHARASCEVFIQWVGQSWKCVGEHFCKCKIPNVNAYCHMPDQTTFVYVCICKCMCECMYGMVVCMYVCMYGIEIKPFDDENCMTD